MRTRLQEKFNLLNIDELDTLNSYATDKDKQTCNNLIDVWRDEGLVKGYFGAKCNEIYRRRRVKNNEILELYIYYCFVAYEENVTPEEQQTFRDLANFYYMQGQYECMKKPRKITDTLYYTLLMTPSANGYTLNEYKGAKALNSTYQIHRLANLQIQQGQKPNVSDMDKEIEKEQTERLSVRETDKGLLISGVIDMILIGINNMAKVEGIATATEDLPKKDVQVRFVAVMDERTTKMCKSLDGQLFNVHEKNTFTRWSDTDKAMRTYTCRGLVVGLNMPPINNRLSLVSFYYHIQHRLSGRGVVRQICRNENRKTRA